MRHPEVREEFGIAVAPSWIHWERKYPGRIASASVSYFLVAHISTDFEVDGVDLHRAERRSGARRRPIQILLALAALGGAEPVGDRVCRQCSLRHWSRQLRVNGTLRVPSAATSR